MPVRRNGFGDGEISINADEAEKQHAAVEADLVNGVHGFAHQLAQDPLCHGVGRPEGEGQSEEQVGKGQVEQVHVRHGLEPFEMKDCEDDQQVSCHTQQADDREESWHEPSAKIRNFFSSTDCRNTAVIHAGNI